MKKTINRDDCTVEIDADEKGEGFKAKIKFRGNCSKMFKNVEDIKNVF